VFKKTGYGLLFCLLLLCGCSENPEKKLVGRWQETTNPLGTLIFSSDHTGWAYWPNDSGKQERSPMKWEILKGEKMVSVITPPGPVNFEIRPDRLVAPNGVELVKVK